MARPLRLQVADGVYHVTARGNERKRIYRDADDGHHFLEILNETLERFRWRCLGYCLMTNHYHLLVRTLEPNLSRGMRDLNGVYAQWFNRRYGRDGHLFQGRFRAILVERDEHLLSAVAYIVRNPVRAGICETPGGWPWSSHDDFMRRHLIDVEGSPDIPATHVRPPVPPLEDILADGGNGDAIAEAYERGYTMPAIARRLGLHPSTISRRLTRRRAQIKT